MRGRVRRGLRLPGAGDRRGARLLPGRRRRAGRQRGRRDRGRGRDLRAARGRPGRAGRGHAPGPAGAAAAGARDGLHLPDGQRAAVARLRHRARRGAAPRAARRGAGPGGGDRGQGPGRDPAGQAVAKRHRPGRREAVLPVRAGVHLRAEPGRRRRPGPAGVRRQQASGREAGVTPDEIVAELRDGMTIGIGGWGSRRKPMALVRAILRSPLKDLTIVAYAGPDVRLLVAAGPARRVVTGFASLDSIPLEPNFRRARQDGTVELTELDEGMLHWGLLAAAHRLPFLPIRAGLGSGVLEVNPELRTVRSPYPDSEELVAMPALRLDAALVHMNRADAGGNGQYLGPDPYFDDLFCLAAERPYLSCERIVPSLALGQSPPQTLLLNRAMVHGVTQT